MSLYELLMTYIIPHLVDVNLFDGVCSETFYQFFVLGVSLVIVHFFIFVPYNWVLRLARYKPRWRK